MKSRLLGGVLKEILSIGWAEILGELIGGNLDSLGSECTNIILALKTIVHGELSRPNPLGLTFRPKNKSKFLIFEMFQRLM